MLVIEDNNNMLNLLQIILQYIAIITFAGLSIIGVIQHNWNFGFGLNLALVLLYIFLYLQPIK